MSEEELDRAICANAQAGWRKTAFVIAKVEEQSGEAHDRIGDALQS
jgi:hypothetical protein